MTQRDRDRLVVLKKAHKKLITQRLAAEELGITERHRSHAGQRVPMQQNKPEGIPWGLLPIVSERS